MVFGQKQLVVVVIAPVLEIHTFKD